MTQYEAEKYLNKSEKAVKYLISVWNEVQGNWKEKPDHVQQMFLKAEEEIKEKINNIQNSK